MTTTNPNAVPNAASNTVPALQLSAVERSYRRGFWGRRAQVLRSVDLTLQAGERVGLVGPNGCGKSTLLRLAAGVENPDAGAVRVFGEPLTEFATRARIGFAPEGFPFPTDLTAERALRLGAVLAGLSVAEAKEGTRVWLERFGLTGASSQRLGRFSRGMKQRFALAHALIATPDLLLLDEPSNGLDAPGFESLARVLEEATERGAATLICSHLIGDLVTHADRLAVLVDGELRSAGTVHELSSRGRRVQVELEDVDEAAWPVIERAVTDAGGRVVGRSPSNAALVELFDGK